MAKDPSKTERATPKRRNKLRKEGNVAKSMEFTKTCTLIVGFATMYFYLPYAGEKLGNYWVECFNTLDENIITPTTAYAILWEFVTQLALICGPIVFAVAISAFVTLRRQVGKLWTTKVFKFKWSRFNIVNGLKRVFFSFETYVRLLKAVAIAAIIGYVPFMFIVGQTAVFPGLYYTNAHGLASYLLTASAQMIKYTMIPVVAYALFDLWHSFHQYEENNKMTKAEVKDEMRQAFGDPVIKNKQKQKMMQFMQQRMMQSVPKADVVVTNPTHYAVALQYDPTICPAPVVLAKGVDKLALRIKDVAREHGVPIKENKLLARSLYSSVEIGEPIPEDLYKAVATIIAEIWRLKGKIQ